MPFRLQVLPLSRPARSPLRSSSPGFKSGPSASRDPQNSAPSSKDRPSSPRSAPLSPLSPGSRPRAAPGFKSGPSASRGPQTSVPSPKSRSCAPNSAPLSPQPGDPALSLPCLQVSRLKILNPSPDFKNHLPQPPSRSVSEPRQSFSPQGSESGSKSADSSSDDPSPLMS